LDPIIDKDKKYSSIHTRCVNQSVPSILSRTGGISYKNVWTSFVDVYHRLSEDLRVVLQ
jgi:hypothetical protein